MADREQDALVCATRRREREARPVDLERYACRCDHDHPPEVSWCDLCENPVFHGPDPAYRHGGPDAGWYLRTMDGWRRITDTEAANERYEGMRHFMHDPNEDGPVRISAGDRVQVKPDSYGGAAGAGTVAAVHGESVFVDLDSGRQYVPYWAQELDELGSDGTDEAEA
jgi:hypothetical protein